MFVHVVQNSLSYFSWSMIHFVQAMSSAASVPGRMGSHTSAFAASMVMRGSMTTVFKPFSRTRNSASARPPPSCSPGRFPTAPPSPPGSR